MTDTPSDLLSTNVISLRSYFFPPWLQLAKNNSMEIIGVVSIMVLVVGLCAPVNFADAKFDDKDCKSMYDRYKELGEKKFREKYRSKYFVNDCIKLYKDPSWYFVGKNKIDKNYEKLQILMGQTSEDRKADVKVLSILLVGQEKYMIQFQACATKSSIQQPSFLLKSKIEQYVGLSGKVLQAGKCNNYVTQIKATQSSNIQVEYVPDPLKYPDVKSKIL